jgi:hypothetical protein
MQQDIKVFLTEVTAGLESQQVYEVLTAQGLWKRTRIAFIDYQHTPTSEIDGIMIKVIDLENGATITLFAAEISARLRKPGEVEEECITQGDIEQVINLDIVGRPCEILSGAGWLRSYVDLIEGFDANWYHAHIRVGRSVVLQGVEVVTRLRFPLDPPVQE